MSPAMVLLNVFIIGVAAPGGWMQLVRVRRRRSSDGISCAYVAMAMVAGYSWLLYGVLAHEWIQLVVNGGFTTSFGLTLVTVIRLNPSARRLAYAAGLYILLSTVVGILYGAVPIGIMAGTVGFAFRWPQMLKSWREPGASSLSIGNFITNGAAALGWLTFGILRGDLFVCFSSCLTVMSSVFIVACSRRRGDEPSIVHGGGDMPVTPTTA